MFAGAVNHSSPVPASWMPKSVPLRAIVTTTEEPSMPLAAAIASLQAGMTRLRAKWSLAPTKRQTSAMSSALRSPTWVTMCGSRSRRNISVALRLRL